MSSSANPLVLRLPSRRELPPQTRLEHAIANPLLHRIVGHAPVLLTLCLLFLLAVVFFLGFSEAIGLAQMVSIPYLVLNLVILLPGVWELLLHAETIQNWRLSLLSHGDWTAIFIVSALLFPKLPRFGMAPRWVAYRRPLVLVLLGIDVVITLIFRADVEAQGGAYATAAYLLWGESETALMAYTVLVRYWAWTKRTTERPRIFLMSG